MAEEFVLQVDNLQVEYGQKKNVVNAVQGISFSLKKGELLGIVGESGCGKTSVAMAMMGLLGNSSEVSGKITIGKEEYDLSDIKYKQWQKLRGKKIAMIFQDSLAALNPLMRVGEQIAEAMYVHKEYTKAQARERAIELLKLVEISEPEIRFKQYPHELSGGMRQRVSIAIALSNNPEILICDEPTTALDVTVQAQILDTIKKLQISLGMSVVLVTHDLGVVNAVADNVIVMYGSKIVEQGITSDVLNRPEHPYTLALLATMPEITLDDEILMTIPGSPPHLSSLLTSCPFASRCIYVTQECREQMPELRASLTNTSSGHLRACFHPQEMQMVN